MHLLLERWAEIVLTSINGKKKFKRILVEGENFKLRKLPSKDFITLFSSRRRACLVLKHNRVSEVFKGFEVHDFEYLLRPKKFHFQMEISFMSLEMCHLLLTFKKLLENELRFVRRSLRIFCHAGSVTRIAFKYKLTGFRIIFFKNDFPVYYFVFVYSWQ